MSSCARSGPKAERKSRSCAGLGAVAERKSPTCDPISGLGLRTTWAFPFRMVAQAVTTPDFPFQDRMVVLITPGFPFQGRMMVRTTPAFPFHRNPRPRTTPPFPFRHRRQVRTSRRFPFRRPGHLSQLHPFLSGARAFSHGLHPLRMRPPASQEWGLPAGDKTPCRQAPLLRDSKHSPITPKLCRQSFHARTNSHRRQNPRATRRRPAQASRIIPTPAMSVLSPV